MATPFSSGFANKNITYKTITPTFTNVSLGTGGFAYIRYYTIGDTITYEVHISFGTGCAITGSPVSFTCNLPEPRSEGAFAGSIGQANDMSAQRIYQIGLVKNGANFFISKADCSGSVLEHNFITNLLPFAIDDGDVWVITGTYESA